MDLKKKWKRFWTLDRHHEAGFTLVELIVVIAIMAILGSVGTVGYGGYIKATNKNADKKLVGDVMRAIETGTNSTMFVNDDSFKMGKISYPVGLVTLSPEGAQIVVSETAVKNENTGKCDIRSITVNVAIGSKQTFKCPIYSGIKTNKDVYSLSQKTVTCCLTHSAITNVDTDIDSGKPLSYVHVCKPTTFFGQSTCSGTKWNADGTLIIPAGTTNVVLDESKLYTESSASGMCEMGYANQYGVFDTPQITADAKSGAIHDALVAAFGENYDSYLTLKYDGWTSEEGVDYASFYTSAPAIMDDLEELSGLLALASKSDKLSSKLNLAGQYKDGADVTAGVSNTITTNHTPDTWEKAWENAAKDSWEGQQGFGLAGMENYAAARKIYNTSFAEYVAKMDSSITEPQLEAIRNFNKGGLDGTSLTMPALVNTDAFTNETSPLKQSFVDAGDTDAGKEGSAFNRVAELYEKYKQSEACKENAKVVYDTLGTIADTSDVANKYVQMNGGDYFDYYGSYVKEMSAMYSAAETASDGGIVIVVSVQTNEDGVTETVFNVSPSAANPRPAKTEKAGK